MKNKEKQRTELVNMLLTKTELETLERAYVDYITKNKFIKRSDYVRLSLFKGINL